MEHDDAVQALAHADGLSGRARRSGQWFTRYLLAYAVATFALAVGFALVGPRWGASLLTPIWVVFVITVSVYASRQQSALRGTTRLHNLMIASWAVLWVVTLLGSFAFHQALWWWLLGGVAMAMPALVVRRIVQRRIGTL